MKQICSDIYTALLVLVLQPSKECYSRQLHNQLACDRHVQSAAYDLQLLLPTIQLQQLCIHCVMQVLSQRHNFHGSQLLFRGLQCHSMQKFRFNSMQIARSENERVFLCEQIKFFESICKVCTYKHISTYAYMST